MIMMIPLKNVCHKLITHFILINLSFSKIMMKNQPPIPLKMIHLPISFFGSSIFKYTFNFKELPLTIYITVDVETSLIYQKRDLFRKLFLKGSLRSWILRQKKLLITASPVLLEKVGVFPSLYIVASTVLITIENQIVKNLYKFPPYTDDIFSSEEFRLCLPQTMFQSALDKVHSKSLAGLHFAEWNINQSFLLYIIEKDYQSSFINVLNANWINTKTWINTNLQSCFSQNCQLDSTIVSVWILNLQ